MTAEDIVKKFRNYPPDKVFALAIWQAEDIHHQATTDGVEVTEDEANDILDSLEHNHDACYGISWDTVSSQIWSKK